MFSNTVRLYRLCGRPPFVNGGFSYSGPLNDELRDVINSIQNALPADRYGEFDESVETNSSNVTFEFRIFGRDGAAFYQNFREFVQSSSAALNKGKLVANFYIQEDDWTPSDGNTHDSYEKLIKACRLIKCLERLAVGNYVEEGASGINLFFALPAEDNKPPRAVLFPIRVDAEILSHDLLHLRLLESLTDPRYEEKMHFSERKMIFRTALADLIEDCDNQDARFTHLVLHWQTLLKNYMKNLNTYVHGYSFDKIRLEIARAQIEFGSKLSGVLGDIAGKLLALPLSLAGLVALHKSGGAIEFICIAAGLVSITPLLRLVLKNQELQIGQLKNSFNIVFDQLNKKKEVFPKALRAVLDETISGVKKREELLEKSFRFFRFMTWGPVVGVVAISVIRNYEAIRAFTTYMLRTYGC